MSRNALPAFQICLTRCSLHFADTSTNYDGNGATTGVAETIPFYTN